MKITDPTIKGRLGVNAMKAKKHLYDHIIYDSTGERDFAAELDTNKDVAVYVKLPDGFYISTPVGRYNPDWAIAFYKGNIKHIYFVAETKGSVDDTDFEWLDEAHRKILCKRFSTKSRKLALQKRSSLPAESLAPSIPPRPGRYARRWRRECRPGGGGA